MITSMSSPRAFLLACLIWMPAPAQSPHQDRIDDEASSKPALRVGVDANYSLDMEQAGSRWSWDGESSELFEGMAHRGITDLRVRLWTKEDGPSGRSYATRVVQRANAAGIRPYLVLFLSDDWADLMKQPCPLAWKDLSFEDRKIAIRDYSRTTVQHFRENGLSNHLYEIGNEIDYGICGEYPGKSAKKTAESLRRRIWLRSAELIKASQSGVIQADPEARFMLHISHWWDPEFCTNFFRFMIEQGVQVDVAGLSYFPTSNIGGSRDLEEFSACVHRLAKAIDRKVIIAETAYPSTRDFKGQFSRWKYEVAGYPLSPEGQQRWISDFLALCKNHPDIEAVYYWSPEWYGEGMWKGFALFDPQGHARPAWSEWSEVARRSNHYQKPVYIELVDDRLLVVPVVQARRLAHETSQGELQKFGKVDVDYIRSLETLEPIVAGYSIHMKSTLQKNLSLRCTDPQSGFIVMDRGQFDESRLEDLLKSLVDENAQLVLVVRTRNQPHASTLLRALESRGAKVRPYFLTDEQPLVFGMSSDFEPRMP